MKDASPRARRVRRVLTYVLIFALFPILLFVGAHVLVGSHYYAVMSVAAALSVGVFILNFERGDATAEKLMMIAVLTALGVVGRIVFEPIPGFKPVSAMVIITGMYLGADAGFMAGAMSALISNFFFSQGPWTPFQMFVWGLIGFFAGVLAPILKKRLWLLCVYGALSGVAFSLMMDVFTVTWYSGTFSFSAYLTALAAAIWFTVSYAVSNVVFLLLLARPIGKRLDRLIVKYGIR